MTDRLPALFGMSDPEFADMTDDGKGSALARATTFQVMTDRPTTKTNFFLTCTTHCSAKNKTSPTSCFATFNSDASKTL